MCYFQDLFNIAHSILVQFLSCFFSMHLVNIHVVNPYSRIDTTTGWKKSCFILSDRSDFHMIDSLSIVHAFARHILTSLSIDGILLPRYMNLFTNFRALLFRVEMAPSQLKHMYSVLLVFTRRIMSPAACSWLCSKDSAWVGIFARSSMLSASVIVSVVYHLALQLLQVIINLGVMSRKG